MSDRMLRLTYLTIKGCRDGGAFWEVQEASAQTMLAHPEWDLRELKTYAEWDED
jgi:hypothetical protein